MYIQFDQLFILNQSRRRLVWFVSLQFPTLLIEFLSFCRRWSTELIKTSHPGIFNRVQEEVKWSWKRLIFTVWMKVCVCSCIIVGILSSCWRRLWQPSCFVARPLPSCNSPSFPDQRPIVITPTIFCFLPLTPFLSLPPHQHHFSQIAIFLPVAQIKAFQR